MRLTSTLLPLLMAALASGCATQVEMGSSSQGPGPQPSGCQAASWAGALEAGGGQSCFASLAEGQSIALIAGPQGGYHVWVGLRCRGCASSGWVDFGVQDMETGEPLAMQQQNLPLSSNGDYLEIAAVPAYMPGDSWEGSDPAYLGHGVRIWVELDIGSERVTDDVVVTLDRVEYWSPPCDDPSGCNGRL